MHVILFPALNPPSLNFPMKNTFRKSIFTVIGLVFAGSLFSLSSCSTETVTKNQQSITNVQQGMLDRSEARRKARDERFTASRQSLMSD